jgi:hypothetical protein
MRERNDFYGFTTTVVTNTYEPYAERPPFLVDSIVHQTMTLMYGEAKSGKSTLAAALAAALVNGEADFLGRTISPATYSVGIIAADFGDDQAYGDLLRQVLKDGTEVPVYALDRPPDRRVWEGLQLASRQRQHDLMIVDNLTAFVDGSLNDDVPVNTLYDELDRFVRDGTAVLLVAHSSEKAGEHGRSPHPMGSSAIRARARWLWRVERRTTDTRLSFHGNYAAEHEITVSLAAGTPRFEALGTVDSAELTERRVRRRRERSDQTRVKSDQIREVVLSKCQGMNGKQAAELLAGRFGGAASTHEAQLSRGAYGVKRDGQTGRWAPILKAA